MSDSKKQQARSVGTPLGSGHVSTRRSDGTAACVWRDSLGPGYAVGVSGSLANYAAATAQRPYRCT